MGTADEAELVPPRICAWGGTTSVWSALDECLVRSEAVIMGTADEAELVPPRCGCLKSLLRITAEWGGGDAALIHTIGGVVFV